MQTPVSMPWFRTRPRALHTFAPVFPPFHPLPRWEAQTKPLSKQLRSLHKAEVALRPVSSLTQHASAVSHLNLTFQTSVSYPKRRQIAFWGFSKREDRSPKMGKDRWAELVDAVWKNRQSGKRADPPAASDTTSRVCCLSNEKTTEPANKRRHVRGTLRNMTSRSGSATYDAPTRQLLPRR